MARYEFVEGKSSKFWEIRLEGTSLVVNFGRIGAAGQTQTKTFNTPELARKEHDRLVAEKTKKGYALATGSEGATAAPSPARPAKGGAPAGGGFRKDLYVYNEATGFVITSKRVGGKGIDGGSERWHKAVRTGDLIPIELTQDDPFFIRVVVGGGLEPQEAEEWVGRLDWKLRVPDGNLVVCGGAEYVMEEFEGDESEYLSEYVRHVKIARGDYRATVYMYFGGVNGRSCLSVARDGDEPDPLGEWFRRTRPDEEFPAWLHNDCVADPDEDPGHEETWKRMKEVPDPNENYVDFLLHLTPLEPAVKVTMPPIAEEGGESGWFCQPFVCRVPDRIPLGLAARDPEGVEKKSAEAGPAEEKPAPVSEHTEGFALEPVTGTVDVPLERLVRLFRLPWFCHSWSLPYIRIDAPAGSGPDLPPVETDAEGVRVTNDGGTISIAFVPTGRQGGALRGLAAVAPLLKGIPDGSTLRLDAAYLDEDELKKPRPLGLHRYEGVIRNDVLKVTGAFPVHDAGTLNAALALSAQAEDGTVIDAGTEDIAARVMKSLEAHPYFQDNPAVKRGPTGIATTNPDPMLLAVVAEEVFHKTFKDEFPLFDFDADDEEDDEDIGEYPVVPRGEEPPMPPIGDELMKGGRRRVFYSSDAATMGPDALKHIADAERDLLPLGFKHVADVVCKPMQAVLVRAYAQEDGTVWAALLISSYSRGTFEFITYFQQGASLVTTTNGTARDELYRNLYKTRRDGGRVLDMWADHQKRAAYLSLFHGAPQKVVATPEGLAAAVELAIQRQEETKATADKKLLLVADGRSYFAAEARGIDPAAPPLISHADGKMDAMGFVPVGDVVGTFFTSHAYRGYIRPGGDTWALLMIEASTLQVPDGAWDFVTAFEKGAVLSSTRGALSKDEPKRKIFRILDPSAPPDVLLTKHEARKGELSKKWGRPLPVSGDMKGLAAEAANLVRRTIG
ncbi:MAG TPA: WGR domain-containing protein [Vicinamibacterales bacterium]|nr:WGR domain-containing protein [Vicinamibacterales bacterium]